MPAPPLRPFWLGLLLGGAASGAWSTFPPSASAPSPPPLLLPAWDWRASATPPPLPPDAYPGHIAAWLDLRGPTGAPADFAPRADTLRALLIRLPPDAYPGLLAPLLARTTPADRRLLQLAFERFAELRPSAALQWAATAPPAPDFAPRRFTALALQAWARQDPAAAANWLAALPDPELATALAPALLDAVAEAAPSTALMQFGPSLWRDGAGFPTLRPTLLAWVERDPAGALSWLLAQPDPRHQRLSWIRSLAQGPRARALFAAIQSETNLQTDREPALRIALRLWSRENPPEILAWINAIPERHRRHDLLDHLSQALDELTPEQALPFALALPAGADRLARIGTLLGAWAKRDPAATLAWIDAQTDSDVAASGGAVVVALLATIARDEPATAIAEWQNLRDPQVRAAALPTLFEIWSSRDPAAALRWIETQPPADQNPLRQALVGTAPAIPDHATPARLPTRDVASPPTPVP